MKRSPRKSRHTTRLEGFPAKVTILRDRHPLQGQSLELFGWAHRHGCLHLTLVLPDGSRSLFPAAWTDLDPNRLPTSPSRHSPSPSASMGMVSCLLHACKVVDSLLRRLDPSAEPSKTPSTEERKRASTTAPLVRSASARSRSKDLARTRSPNKSSHPRHALQAHQQGRLSGKPARHKGGQT